MENIIKAISKLFEDATHEKLLEVTPLPPSGSYRLYYRLRGTKTVLIAVYNADAKENWAFVQFTKRFVEYGLSVPTIIAEDLDQHIYLQTDLGDMTLFSLIEEEKRNEEGFSDRLVEKYKAVLAELPKFQVLASKDFDYSICYPRESFDEQSMMWDLNYFKYYFLKLARVPFDEQLLEDDFRVLVDFLLQADRDYFLYRDFQSRNIMIYDDKPYFIDYQGGRRGALQYDLASLLYDGKANLDQDLREELLLHYMDCLSEYIPVDRQKFLQFYQGYVLIRIMQAMGAYGFRGFYEKKEHFLKSIPFALKNISYLLTHLDLPIQIPTLLGVLSDLPHSSVIQDIVRDKNVLTVQVQSFSYRRGYPFDASGNGGGFVFDCRSIHNPGRYDEYKKLTGKDAPVIAFLEKQEDVKHFLDHVFSLVDASVEKYIARDFNNLMVSFGCTGGQHRSVYSAERLAQHLKAKYRINVDLSHRETNYW